MSLRRSVRRSALIGCVLAASGVALVVSAPGAPPRVPTTLSDFYFYGHQPKNNSLNGGSTAPIAEVSECSLCHSDMTEETQNELTHPYNRWSTSMMAQSARDPVFFAAMQIAEKDAAFSTDFCVRCHFPGGWAENRGPTRPAGNPTPFEFQDFNGVSCSVCHRMVDPVENVPSPTAGSPGDFTPTTDLEILQDLGINRPPNFAVGGPVAANSFILDPQDRRRGPFDLVYNPYHAWLKSDFHSESRLCASCHDVSNPAFTRQGDGTYAINTLDDKHPTGNKYDMFPVERTYSEWLASSFAAGPVTLTVPNPNNPSDPPVGRYAFDGVTRTDDDSAWYIFNSQSSYQSCQDCHQPRTEGKGCNLFPPTRDVPVHNFAGSNSWVQKAIFTLYGSDTGVTEITPFVEAIDRNVQMLRKAADLELSTSGSNLIARVINQTGHKFPTGYVEGRRAWVNVRYFDASNALIDERGAYNYGAATLNAADTKVYQSDIGIDENVAAYLAQRAIDLGNPALALPYGPSFHFAINNKVFHDNRIPPRGFTNAAFAAIQASPVGYTYSDGQYWDDTVYSIPPGAVRAEVRLYHQTTTREYVEFLRDHATDVTDLVPQPNPPPPVPLPIGQIVYDQWVLWGKSAPVEIGRALIDFGGACNLADITETGGTLEEPGSPDGQLTLDDILVFIDAYNDAGGCPGTGPCNLADITESGGTLEEPGSPDGQLTLDDILVFVDAYNEGCG